MVWLPFLGVYLIIILMCDYIRVAYAEEVSQMKTQLLELKEDIDTERKRTAGLDNSLRSKTLEVNLVFKVFRCAHSLTCFSIYLFTQIDCS